MLKLLSLFLFLISSSAFANPYDFRVVRVLDGDTVEFDAPFLPKELKQVLKLRIEGVDTPEKGRLGKCEYERQRAEAATRFTQQQVARATQHQIIILGWDKYGGRVIGDLLLDGKSLKEMLLIAKYAMPYDGKRKTGWC
jgi:endonuclease YncB( thermonuclease family)